MNTKHRYRLLSLATLLIFLGWNGAAQAQNDTIVKAQKIMYDSQVAVVDNTQESDYESSAKKKHCIPERRHQVSIGYGILSANQVGSILPLFFCMHHSNNPIYRQCYTYGAIQIGYDFRITKVVGVGIQYVCEPTISKLYNNQELACKFNLTTHTLLPTLKINWLNKRVVTMYSKVGFGVTFSQSGIKNYQPDKIEIFPEQQRVFFAYQFTLVGIKLGNTQYAGFLQLGAGMEGWFCAGFRTRF